MSVDIGADVKLRVTLIVAGLALAAIAGVYLQRARAPESTALPAPVVTAGLPPVPGAAKENAAAVDDKRRLETAAAYAELDASRKSLQKQLSDLKALLWGRELPAELARKISRDMMSAQYLLRNPPLLGAFSDAAGVYAEKDRVKAARARLEEISRTVEVPKTP